MVQACCMSFAMKPKTGRKRPSRGNRYYRCAKFGGVYYEFVGVTGGCPNRHCLRAACPSYIKPRERPGRPPTEGVRLLDEDRIFHRDRMREFRAATDELTLAERSVLAADDAKSLQHLVDGQLHAEGPLPVDHPRIRQHLRCRRYLEQNLTCRFSNRHCKSCAYRLLKPRGRRQGDGLWDWTDPEQRREYCRFRKQEKESG